MRASEMRALKKRILSRIAESTPDRWLYSQVRFFDLGHDYQLVEALSELVAEGHLHRVDRGRYGFPWPDPPVAQYSPLDFDSAVASITDRRGYKVMMDGQRAADGLNLDIFDSTLATYVTDGPSELIRFRGRTLQLRNAPSELMQWFGRPAAPVVLALLWLGPAVVANPLREIVPTLRRSLPQDVVDDLCSHTAPIPGWITRIVDALVE